MKKLSLLPVAFVLLLALHAAFGQSIVIAPAETAAPKGLVSKAVVATSTPNPSVFGSLVNITASIQPSAATGTVTFYSGTQVLGHAVLAGGTATLSTLALPPGANSISAYYSGDGAYRASRSSILTHKVNAAASGALAFGIRPTVSVGSSPSSIAVGDFNGDGQADLAVANFADNTVSILLGNGTGGFSNGNLLATGVGPRAVAVGDFNRDGNLDLAVANHLTGTVTILLGDGNGHFAPANGSPFLAGRGPVHIATGDFNNDGSTDLAIANSGGNDLTVLLGDGNGGFHAAHGSPFATGKQPAWAAVADFNGDGNADLAVVNSSDATVSILLGDGAGNFRSSTSSLSTGINPHALVVADFNGDGNADLAIGSDDSVTILLGDGIGGFDRVNGPSPLLQTATNYLTAGDFNGDGKPDLAIADSDGAVTVLLGDGTGGFTASGMPVAVGGGLNSLAIGDFNGDGRADLAVSNAAKNNIAVLLGTEVPGVAASSTSRRSLLTYSLSGSVNARKVSAKLQTNTPACTFSLSNGALNGPGGPSSMSFSSAGSSSSTFSVFATSQSCGWTTVSNATWLHVLNSSNAGNGTVTYKVDANTTTTGRIGTFTVAGLTFTILEAGTSQTLACSTSTTSKNIRAEGITELVGDLILQCSGTAGSAAVNADIVVALNVNLTSRIVNSGVTSEALLLLNDPATPVMNTNAFLGSDLGSNLVFFRQIPIAAAGGANVSLKIRITNIRADAWQFGIFANANINALVSLNASSSTGGVAVPLANRLQTVAVTNPSMDGFAGNPTAQSGSASFLPVTFEEDQANTFRVKIASNQDPSQPGTSYLSESGFVNSAAFTPNTVGKADTGTRLLTRLRDIPAGVQVYAPVFPTSTSPTNAQLVSANGLGVGGTFIAGTSQFGGLYQQIAVDGNGNATATWEITSVASTGSLRSLTFKFVLTTDTGTAGNVETANTIAPISPITQATNTDPIPRFVETQGIQPNSIALRTSINVTLQPQGILGLTVTTSNDDDSNSETGTKQTTNLPPGLVNANCIGPDGKTYTPVNGAVTVPVGTLNAGQTATTTCTATPSGTSNPGPVIAGSTGALPNTDPNGGTASASIPADPVNVMFKTSPTGLVVKDGLGNTLTSITTDQFSALSFSVATPQNGTPPVTGVQYAFNHWSDNLSTTPIRNNVMPPVGGGTITAVFSAQYQVTVTASPAAGGTVMLTPSSTGNFYSDGTSITITATPATGYAFIGFSGDENSSANPFAFSWLPGQGKPLHITANFFAVTRFVTSLYTDLLDRSPDPSGLSYWSGLLTSGAYTPAQMAAQFFTSAEFSGGGLAIIQYYLAVVGRDPDFAGWFFWFNSYINGVPLSSILNTFLSSAEFQNTYGSLTNAQFVNLVYQNVLGRAPDPGGASFWVNSLNNGTSRTTMFAQFIASAEFQTTSAPRAYANLLYMGFLRRTADPSGLAFWTNALTGNIAQLPVAVNAFITSAEYLARFP